MVAGPSEARPDAAHAQRQRRSCQSAADASAGVGGHATITVDRHQVQDQHQPADSHDRRRVGRRNREGAAAELPWARPTHPTCSLLRPISALKFAPHWCSSRLTSTRRETSFRGFRRISVPRPRWPVRSPPLVRRCCRPLPPCLQFQKISAASSLTLQRRRCTSLQASGSSAEAPLRRSRDSSGCRARSGTAPCKSEIARASSTSTGTLRSPMTQRSHPPFSWPKFALHS